MATKKSPATAGIPDSFVRNVDEYVTKDQFEVLLASKKKLRIKFGADVTSPSLHVGHAVNLWLMRALQERGHKVVFLIGDFTTRIGDPTGKSETRPVIAEATIKKNAKDYLQQISKVLLTKPAVFEVRRNSEWYGKMPTAKFLELLSLVTHAQVIARDMFQKRISEGREIRLHELMYPLLQGYDSVMLKSDATIVGSDQLFNEMMGRFFQEKFGQKPQAVVTTKILPGVDGKEKMSKSIGNDIPLAATPREKFGRTMSIPDTVIVQYLAACTAVPLETIAMVESELAGGAMNPRDAKLFLAEKLVERYHGAKAAMEEKHFFINTFSRQEVPEDIPTLRLAGQMKLLDVLKTAMPEESNSSLRRLIEGGGVEIASVRQADFQAEVILKSGDVIKVGKRRWWRVA